MPSKPQGKNIMDLPRELRDLIYFYALVPLHSPSPEQKHKDKTPIRIALRSRFEWRRLKRGMACLGVALPKPLPALSPCINTALFCTNKAMQAEAEAAFYRHNTFVLHPSWFWGSKPEARRELLPTALTMLRKLYVTRWCDLAWECRGMPRRAAARMDEA